MTEVNAVEMVTIHVGIGKAGTYQVPRATYVMPDGQHDMERWDQVVVAEAKHYSVRLLDHGPFMNSLQACQYGVHTSCHAGDHKHCPFQPGLTHENGSVLGGDFLKHRDEHGYWRLVHDETGRALQLLPSHVWHCSCDCHSATPHVPAAPVGRYVQEAFQF